MHQFDTGESAIILSIGVVAGLFLPFFQRNRGATLGLIAFAVAATGGYLLNNPHGIDNMSIAAVTLVLVLPLKRLLGGARRCAVATPVPGPG